MDWGFLDVKIEFSSCKKSLRKETPILWGLKGLQYDPIFKGIEIVNFDL
jgi:hypothetical protein